MRAMVGALVMVGTLGMPGCEVTVAGPVVSPGSQQPPTHPLALLVLLRAGGASRRREREREREAWRTGVKHEPMHEAPSKW